MPGRYLSPLTSTFAITTILAAASVFTACGRPTSDIQASTLQAQAPVPAATPDPGTAAADAVTRGAYLVAVGGCNDCHTPFKMGPRGPEPDMSQMLSGHPAAIKMPPAPRSSDAAWVWHGSATNTAFAGPWGVSYAINLTPDEETGIGSWSEKVFVSALKTGKHLGVGRPILPPMPWPGYAQMTEDDLKAVFAYLRTVPAKRNKVPEAIVAPPPHS